MKRIRIHGDIRNDKPQIYGINRWFEFFKQNNNKAFIIEAIAIERGSVDHYVWYIVKMIVPAFIDGYRQLGDLISFSDAIDKINYLVPLFRDESERRKKENAFFDLARFEPDCEIDKEVLAACIEWLHHFCAENFHIIVGNYKSL